MEKEVTLKAEGLVGFIEAFREVANKSGVQKGDIVIFLGCPPRARREHACVGRYR